MTEKQFVDALSKGKVVPNGTEIVVDSAEKKCVIQGVKGLKHFPGVKIVGNLFIIDCPDLETIDTELTVTEEFQVNSCPNLTGIHNPQCSVFVLWICPKVTQLPELTHEGLLEVRLAGIGCTKVSNIKSALEVRFHQCARLVEVSDISTDALFCSESPELGIITNINVTRELSFNGCPMVTELPDIGEGNHLGNMMLADTGVKIIPSKFFDTDPSKPILEHSQVLILNNPDLRMVPAIVAEEIDILNCPGVHEIPRGTRVNMLELSTWDQMDCEEDVTINERLRVRDLNIPDIKVFTEPGYLTAQMILDTENVELRRVLIEKMGAGAFVKAAGGTIIDEITKEKYDELTVQRGSEWVGMKDAKLWLLKMAPEVIANGARSVTVDESIVVAELQNSTPEPDGSIKTYFLRVPPETTTVIDAVAWTFGETAETYTPMIES